MVLLFWSLTGRLTIRDIDSILLSQIKFRVLLLEQNILKEQIKGAKKKKKPN